MKIVVFGPERRVGALRGELIVDLSLAYAKFLRERQNERQAVLLAAALVPGDLAAFIEAGTRALDYTATALDYLFGEAFDQLGVHGEALVHPRPRCTCTRHARMARASPAPVEISPTISRAWRRWGCCPARAPCRSTRRPRGSGTPASGVSGR